MNIKDLKELKAFILWAKKEKLNAVKIGDVEFNFTNLAFVPEFVIDEPEDPRLDKTNINENYPTSKETVEINGDEVDEDLMYWSS